ncbi:hypothetical protein LTAR_03041 [Leptolinea tardivitalis]|nr:hypothetical protein LTAR_03041 [Leptolinea tardivitalis]
MEHLLLAVLHHESHINLEIITMQMYLSNDLIPRIASN